MGGAWNQTAAHGDSNPTALTPEALDSTILRLAFSPEPSVLGNEMQERTIPPAAHEDPNSVEMLRVWIAKKSLHCSMKVGMYSESTKIPEAHAWGLILADVIRHLSRAMREAYGVTERDTEKSVIQSLLAEIDYPTTKVKGEIDKGSAGSGLSS